MSDSIKNSQQLLDIVSTLNGLTPTLRFDLQLGNIQDQMNNVLFLQKAFNLSRQDEISFTKLWSNYQTERAQKDNDELNALKKEAVELVVIIKLSDDKRKRVEQLVNEYEKQNKELDKSAKSAQKLADIFDSIKEIQIAGEAKGLVAEIKTLNDKLLNAVDRTLTISGPNHEQCSRCSQNVSGLLKQDMLNKQPVRL
jgi:aspartyl-tRNA synthetase